MSDLIPPLYTRPYVTQETHAFFAEDAWRPEGANIGNNGEHLTITFLGLNRTSLSQRLCESIVREIPNFAGEILAVDNGSSDEEFARLEALLAQLPLRTRVVRLDKNYGVAGGRNRTMPYVQTPWVMSLDNDVYFIKNPLSSIQRDLSELGCHFMTLAVLNEDEKTNFIRGGHLWLTLQDSELIIGGGSVKNVDAVSDDGPGYLATFMSGCASIFRVDTFLAQEGFDEGMFVGFEDFEFSLRLFRAGLKVGASDIRALVHDHPKPDTTDDKYYEKARFARDRLLNAAHHFEKKHGFRVWTENVDSWISQRERELDLGREQTANRSQAASRPPKVAVVVDIENWALYNIATQLEKHLSNEFEFDIISSVNVDHPDTLAYMTRDHDLCHYLWREPLFQTYSDYRKNDVDKLYGSWDTFAKAVFFKPRTFGVYDHLFLGEAEIQARRRLFNEISSGYTVSSKKLEAIYKDIRDYPPPVAVASDGVDLSRFRPSNLGRLGEIGRRPLRVGWVGNSGWGADIYNDPKGFYSILLPALAQLKEQGTSVEPIFADRRSGFTPHRKMPDYYAGIDVLVCTSSIEGTPNPVLEAMACGVPVISTDVGIVPEALGLLQTPLILPTRSAEALCTILKRLDREAGLAEALSAENLRSIAKWDWSHRVEAFRLFFRKILADWAKNQEPIG